MKYFIGKVIRVDRNGPESRIGKLMDASDDHIAVLTEDEGVVYYNTKHIKSLTDNLKGEMKFNIEVPMDFEFKKAANFQDLLESLKLKWVKINRGGPEKLEGIITEVNKDFVFLINNQEIVQLSMFHIKNISYGVKIENAEKEKSDNQSSNLTGSQSRNKGRSQDSNLAGSQSRNKGRSQDSNLAESDSSNKGRSQDSNLARSHSRTKGLSQDINLAGNHSSNQSKMAESEKQQARQNFVKLNDDGEVKKSKTRNRRKVTSQKTAAEDVGSDLVDLLTTMGKVLTKSF